MQLDFHLMLGAVGTESVSSPGLLVAASLHGEAVLTESVPSQGFPEFGISHGAQVFCHCVLSVYGQIAF